MPGSGRRARRSNGPRVVWSQLTLQPVKEQRAMIGESVGVHRPRALRLGKEALLQALEGLLLGRALRARVPK